MKVTIVIEDTLDGAGISAKFETGDKNSAGYTESLAYLIAQQMFFQVIKPALDNKNLRVKEVPFPEALGLPPKATH